MAKGLVVKLEDIVVQSGIHSYKNCALYILNRGYFWKGKTHSSKMYGRDFKVYPIVDKAEYKSYLDEGFLPCWVFDLNGQIFASVIDSDIEQMLHEDFSLITMKKNKKVLSEVRA